MYAVTSSDVCWSHLSGMPFCPCSQISHSSWLLLYQAFSAPPGNHDCTKSYGWSLLMVWVIHCFAFYHSHDTSSRVSVSHAPLLHRVHHLPAGDYQFHPQLFSQCLCFMFITSIPYRRAFYWIICLWFYPYLFCFYCTVYTLKTKIPIFGLLPLMERFHLFLKWIYSIALNENILQTELCISFANSFFGG